MNKYKLFTAFMLLAGFAMAQTNTGAPIIEFHTLLMVIVAVLTFVLLLLVFTLQKVTQMLKVELSGGKYSTQEDELTFWEKLFSLKPLAAEKEIELDHDFDGIKELNNPIPFWFNFLFYGTIVVMFGYLLVYHVFETSPLQAQEYENEIAAAEVAKQEYIKKAGNAVDENSVILLTDAAKLNQGKETYVAKCAVCHGDKGEGKVGPNLTDAYWLHGGDIKSVFKTIKYGVPSKGMVAWQNSLNGAQIQELASFVLTLQGTNPPGAKEPQGELYNETSSKQNTDSAAVQSN